VTNLLLDTHVLLWVATRDDRLGERAAAAIRDGRRVVYVSAASAWEIAIKRAIGKLDAPHDLAELLARYRFTPLDVTIDHALAVEALPPHHRDPFDRMLVAQARSERLMLVSADPRVRAYEVRVLPANG